MKKTSLLLLFLYSCTIMIAQTISENPGKVKTHHSGFEFSAGYSMVMGNYTSIDETNKKAGYATNGWQIQFTYDWMGQKDFGLAIQYTFQKNPLADTTANIVPDGWYESNLGPGSWTNHYLLAGPVFMKIIGKIHIDAKIMGGLIVSSSANFNTQNPYDSLKRDINLGTGFGYGISAGVGYAFSQHVALKFNLSLMGGWPLKNRQYPAQAMGTEKIYDPVTGLYYYKPIYSAPVEYDIKKVVTTLNPSLGLVYRF